MSEFLGAVGSPTHDTVSVITEEMASRPERVAERKCKPGMAFAGHFVFHKHDVNDLAIVCGPAKLFC